jgi:hypothetical protein
MCSKQEDLLKEQFAQIEDQVQEMSGVLKALEGLISANDGKA